MSVKTWGDFEIHLDRVLGRGGMGAVYGGRQVSLDRPAAIKVLKKDLTTNPEFVKRFHREAALSARLVDSHVVQVFGAGEAEGEHFYAMEYVEGEDFSVQIRAGRRFSADEVLQVAQSVGLALQAAWRSRIIHRDIKPSNIIRTKEGEIKVMDFGLAKNPESDLTQSEVIMGTAKYMSPEQATGGACDIRSDLYSLGVVLYELAVGRPPFAAQSPSAVLYQQVHEKPRPPREINPSVPPELEAIILRLLAKEPEKRFSSPEALLHAVRGMQEGVTPDERATLYHETIRLEPPGGPPVIERTPPPPKRPSSAPLAFSLVAAAVLVGVVGYFVFAAVQSAPALPDPAKPAPAVSKTPEEPAKVAERPAPPPSTLPPSWEELRRKGLEAFGLKQWVAAWTSLEEAKEKGATDVEEKIRQAHAFDLIDKGDEEKDDQKALEHYEAAQRKYLPEDDDLKRKIQRVTFNRWSKSAQGYEGGSDWAQAAADWSRALAAADQDQKPEVEAKRAFCDRFARAQKAKTTRDWELARSIFRELARDPRAYSERIELALREVESELARAAEEARKKVRGEFERVVERIRLAHERADWVEGMKLLDLLGDPKYADLPTGEIKQRYATDMSLGLSPPPGMVFIPGGRFRMGGGGRDLEGPEGDAEVSAFYIDDHKTTAAEYGAFLKEVERTGGHHPGCPKDEPKGKSHTPDGWASERPESPVAGVDWWDAASYAAWAKKRLPREMEWERAASFDPAGRRAYPWGDKYRKEAGRSYLGIDGMGSGLIEWTADWFQKYPWSDTSHNDFGERYRALRGGVLLDEDAELDSRVTHRFWYLPFKRMMKIGFRCAKDVSGR